MKPLLVISLGDPGGVGPEVTFKALTAGSLLKRARCLVVGSSSVLKKLRFKKKLPLHFVNSADLKTLIAGKINFLDIGKKHPGFDVGKVSRRNAAITFASLEQAASMAKAGQADALVTAPINKTTMRLMDPHFHGHTEFLAKKCKARSFAMMFVSSRLKVTLVTIHVAVKNIARLIRRKIVFEKIRLTGEFLKKYYRIPKPKIAVCALNPHGHETGTEDRAEILPAVRLARKKGIQATGPLSADQLFYEAYAGHYDAVVSMYHDQGLAPFKMIAFHDGVNVTLGLPFIRTSPDHGTAFDIAYQGKADARSMTAALNLALKLCLKRPLTHPSPRRGEDKGEGKTHKI